MKENRIPSWYVILPDGTRRGAFGFAKAHRMAAKLGGRAVPSNTVSMVSL